MRGIYIPVLCSTWTVSHHYKKIFALIGRPDTRFHNLRHRYAVAAIRSGDDIKTVPGNLGHATELYTCMLLTK